MKSNQFILLLTIGLVAILLSVGSFLYFNKNKIEDIEGNIKPLEKVVSGKESGRQYNVSGGELPKNSEINFKVGQKFVYKSPEDEYGWFTSTYTIERIEKVDGRDCYIVLAYYETISKEEDMHSNTHYISYCYDIEEGRVLQIMAGGDVIDDGAEEVRATNSFFAYWMLGLTDEAKWNMQTDITWYLKGKEEVKKGKDEFRVIGKERVNNRDSFKVERRIITENIVSSINYYWVDVEKRILLRKEFYDTSSGGKIKYYEEDMIYES